MSAATEALLVEKLLHVVGAALAAGAALTGGGMVLTSVCSSADTALRQKLGDNAGFHEGHWPPAATY